jgi:hypothetical protein
VPYNTDRSRAEEMISRHFGQEGGDHFFYISGIEGRLPISADLAAWCANQLRRRIFVSWLLSSILGGLAAIWMMWKAVFEDSILVGLLGFVPAFAVGLCVYMWAIRPFISLRKQLLEYLGWKRKGMQRAVVELGIFFGGNLILLAMTAFLFFRGITEYFSMIEWQVGTWSSDLEGAGFIALGLAVVSGVILATSRSFVPPDQHTPQETAGSEG